MNNIFQPFAAYLAITLKEIISAVANQTARFPALVPLSNLIVHRLNRTAHRFTRLFERWQAGTLPKPRPSRAGKSRAPSTTAPALRLPRGKAWLLRHAQPSAFLITRLEHMFQDPECLRMLREVPQAGRLLRPLCRMVGVALPEPIRLPPRPPREKRVRVKLPRPPKPSLRSCYPSKKPRFYFNGPH